MYDPRKNSADSYALALEAARNDYLDNRRDGETAEQYRNRVATPITLARTIIVQDAPGCPLIVKTAGEVVGHLRNKRDAHAALMAIAGAMPGLPE